MKKKNLTSKSSKSNSSNTPKTPRHNKGIPKGNEYGGKGMTVPPGVNIPSKPKKSS